jgi:hypothetical protein
VAANVNMPSDFPPHHRSTSPDRAEVLMVVLVTIASVVVCGWIAVWLLSDVWAAWLGAVAGLPVAMLHLRWQRQVGRARFDPGRRSGWRSDRRLGKAGYANIQVHQASRTPPVVVMTGSV